MSTNLDWKLCDSVWLEEYDCVPLSLRSKMLRVKLSEQNHGKRMRNDSFVDQMENRDHNDKGLQIVKQSATTVFATSDKIPSNSGECLDKSDSKWKGGAMYEFDDDLDNVVLGERRRMLISSRRLIQSSGSCIASKFEERANSSKAANPSVDMEKQESNSIQYAGIDQVSNLLSSAYDPSDSKCRGDKTSRGNSTTHDNPPTISVLSSLVNVKKEPVDVSEPCNQSKSGMQNVLISSETLCVKSEPSFLDYVGDELDHLPLSERIKMLVTGAPKRSMDMSDNLDPSKESVDVGTNFLESVQPISINRPLKRRRTATNSVETALEEDAPELLKVLVERGILVGDMKLYGEEDSDGELDDSLSEDGFAELEAVISQLFTQRESFLKFPLLRTKGAKVSYCLACLLSLVEQTKFLQNRKWPVEWGWCRDLQSFIFVFHRHNRIVLERPEYGYATYFFELLNSVPATWQIKRLVTALKLTNCGRITLMENKPLVVGEDLSEVEAKVLADYGWTPNTGLGTMLNYCDRVFHDRKQVMDSSEWRSKIGKQLLNGYNGGNIVSEFFPNRLNEDPCLQEDEDVQVKLEQ